MAISAAIAAISTAASVYAAGSVAAFSFLGFTGFGAIAASFLARTAVGLALNALSPKPKTEGANRGYQVNTKGSALDHQIIYGEARVGGVIIYDETGEIGDDEPDERLFRVIALAGHEVEDYTEFYLDGEQVTFDAISDDVRTIQGSRWRGESGGGRVRIDDRALGTDDQTAFPRLVSAVSGWTSNHRLRGIASIYLELSFEPDVFPSGIPDLTVTVKGKKVYDPRELSHDVNDSSTWAWSDNPALCVADYIMAPFGLNESPENIDWDFVSDAADVCDQTNTNNGEKRYTCNGAFVTQIAPVDILNDLLTSMGGLLWYAQGKWRVKAASYVAPTVTLTEDDLRSSISVKTRHSRRDNFNTVRGTFRGPESNWQVTDYPEVTNTAFLNADNGQESVLDLELPFTDNSEESRRIARIALERNRQQLTVEASFGLNAFQVQTGDIIQLTVDRFGWSAKEFEVVSWTFGLVDEYDLQVQMTLREISESVFDEVDDGVVYERDNTNLLSPVYVPAVGITAEATTQVLREKLTNIININTSSSSPSFVDRVEVEFKRSIDFDTEYSSVGTGELGQYRAIDLDSANYDIRARAINSLGVKGQWTYLFNVAADGLLAPPEDVSSFAAEVNGPTTHLEWEPVPDLDLSYYKIRHSTEETGATWANATTAIDKVPRPASDVSLPTRPGTYHIRAFDKSNVASENYTSVVVSSNNIDSFVNTDTQTEDPSFSGTKTGTQVVSNALELAETDGELATPLSAALLEASAGNEPEATVFAATPSGSTRKYGDINDDGSVTAGDSLQALRYEAGVTIPTDQVAYIEDVLLPYYEAQKALSYGEGTYDFDGFIDTTSVRRVRARVETNVVRRSLGDNNFDDLPGLFDDLPGLFDDLSGDVQLADTNVKFFISTTEDDPSGTPTWSDYQPFRAGEFYGRAFRFRVVLSATTNEVTPSVTGLKAIVEYN